MSRDSHSIACLFLYQISASEELTAFSWQMHGPLGELWCWESELSGLVCNALQRHCFTISNRIRFLFRRGKDGSLLWKLMSFPAGEGVQGHENCELIPRSETAQYPQELVPRIGHNARVWILVLPRYYLPDIFCRILHIFRGFSLATTTLTLGTCRVVHKLCRSFKHVFLLYWFWHLPKIQRPQYGWITL